MLWCQCFLATDVKTEKNINQNLNNLEIFVHANHVLLYRGKCKPYFDDNSPRLITQFQHFCNFHIVFISLLLQQRLKLSWDELQIIHFLSYYLLSMQQPIFWFSFSISSKILRVFHFLFQYVSPLSTLRLVPWLVHPCKLSISLLPFMACRMDKNWLISLC